MSGRKRLRFGDVLEVSTPSGRAYLQYTAKHAEYGETVRVLPGLFDARPDIEPLVQEHKYFAFYPAGLATRRGMVEWVGNFPIPDGLAEPERFRRAGGMDNTGRVLNWIIEDATGDSLRSDLSEVERRLSLAELWNHEMLVQRLVEDWRPEQEA